MSSCPAHHSNAAFWSLQQRLTSPRYSNDRREVSDLEKIVLELQRNLKDAKLPLMEAAKRCLVGST